MHHVARYSNVHFIRTKIHKNTIILVRLKLRLNLNFSDFVLICIQNLKRFVKIIDVLLRQKILHIFGKDVFENNGIQKDVD